MMNSDTDYILLYDQRAWCGNCGEGLYRGPKNRRHPYGAWWHQTDTGCIDPDPVREQPPIEVAIRFRRANAIRVAFLLYGSKAGEREPWIEGNYGGPRYADWKEKHAVELAERQKAVEEAVRGPLLEALGAGGSHPVIDLLERLADMGEHYLRTHDCDHHGYEVDRGAVAAARRIAAALTGVLNA